MPLWNLLAAVKKWTASNVSGLQFPAASLDGFSAITITFFTSSILIIIGGIATTFNETLVTQTLVNLKKKYNRYIQLVITTFWIVLNICWLVEMATPLPVTATATELFRRKCLSLATLILTSACVARGLAWVCTFNSIASKLWMVWGRWTIIGKKGLLTKRIPLWLRVTGWYTYMILVIWQGFVFGYWKSLWDSLRMGQMADWGYCAQQFKKSQSLDVWFNCASHTDVMIFSGISMYWWYRLLAFAIAIWPDQPRMEINDVSTEALEKRTALMKATGVLVPCHKSEEEIARTLRSILKNHIPPENIIVVDNSNSRIAPDNTERTVREVNPRIKYVYLTRGLKSLALLVGLYQLPKHVEYVVHIDDDTIIPHILASTYELFKNPETVGVSLGITAFPGNTLQRVVDFEFKIISAWRYYRSIYSTVWFTHGIIGIWRREHIKELFEEHPFLPFGEDGWNGCMTLFKGKQIRQDIRSNIQTFAPPVLTKLCSSFTREQGYGACTIWKQRADRWFVNAPRRVLWRILLLLTYDCGSITSNILFRAESIKHLAQIAFNLLFPIFFMRVLYDGTFVEFLLCHTIYYVLDLLLYGVVNGAFWRHRPDIQVGPLIVLFFPAYRYFLHWCGIYGHYKCIFYYIPFEKFNTGKFNTVVEAINAKEKRPLKEKAHIASAPEYFDMELPLLLKDQHFKKSFTSLQIQEENEDNTDAEWVNA